MCKLQIQGLILFLDLHQHKLTYLWLWDLTQRFQITISNDLDAATMFYQCLIVVLTPINSCVVKRYKISWVSQRVTHKDSSCTNLLTQPRASSKSKDSFSSWIHTNTSCLTCDFEISLKGFRSPLVMILMQQLCSTNALL